MGTKTYDTNVSVVGKVTQTTAPSAGGDLTTKTYVDGLIDALPDFLGGVTGFWIGNQAAYDAIGTKTATVVYFVTA